MEQPLNLESLVIDFCVNLVIKFPKKKLTFSSVTVSLFVQLEYSRICYFTSNRLNGKSYLKFTAKNQILLTAEIVSNIPGRSSSFRPNVGSRSSHVT